MIMPEPRTDEKPPPWLAELHARYGEPRVSQSDPVKLGGRQRRCWVWFPGGLNHTQCIDLNHNLCIDGNRGHWVISVGTPEIRVEVSIYGQAGREPGDEMVRRVLVLGGLLEAS
jgi:hypothetical protein